MSAIWRLAWLAGDEDSRQAFRELAREGEALLQALGGAVPSPGAASLPTARTESGPFNLWTDQYEPAAEAAHAIPLGILFAGVSGWDPRADRVVSAAILAPPPTREWPQILALLRTRNAPAAIQRSADWFASRAVGLVNGDEPQQLQARLHRAWWDEFAERFQAPAPSPDATTPHPEAEPPAEAESSSGGGAGLIAGLIAAWALSRRKRGGR